MHTGSTTSASCRKRTREESSRIFRFATFCEPGQPAHLGGSSVRENISSLLQFGEPEEGLHGPGTRCWSFPLEIHKSPPSSLPLFVVEEMVELSHTLHCRHCSAAGWGHHMICSKRFHFLLPSKKAKAAKKRANGGPDGDAGDGRCFTAAVREARMMDVGGLLLHGVVHSNGFGHLLCLKGIEAGSQVVSGSQILDLWDRICKALRLRKVSLTDTAKKGSMELRLIYGMAYGEPWFGHWGYRLARGSFGVTPEMYHRSVEVLRGLPLRLLVTHCRGARRELPSVVGRYQAAAGYSLATVGHLFAFMMGVRGRLPPESFSALDCNQMAMEPACRWSPKRLEKAAQVIVEALKRANSRWVTRQDVRDAARAHVGDTGLLDFVLKSLGNHVVGNYAVRRTVNPVTKILEYCLMDLSSVGLPVRYGSHCRGEEPCNPRKVRLKTTRAQLREDMLYLYKYVLMEQSPPDIATAIIDVVPTAVQIILDAKLLIKDYGAEKKVGDVGGDAVINLFCTVLPVLGADRVGTEGRTQGLSPPEELLPLSVHATVGDLKTAVENTFKDIYLCLKCFAAQSVVDVAGAKDSELILEKILPGSRVVVVGEAGSGGGAAGGQGVYEGSDEAVDCVCGAKEDDGERTVACGFCGVLQHTRCSGVADGEDVPPFFLCSHCDQDVAVLPPPPLP